MLFAVTLIVLGAGRHDAAAGNQIDFDLLKCVETLEGAFGTTRHCQQEIAKVLLFLTYGKSASI